MNLKKIIISGLILLAIDAVYISLIGEDYGNMIKRIKGKDMKIYMLNYTQ